MGRRTLLGVRRLTMGWVPGRRTSSLRSSGRGVESGLRRCDRGTIVPPVTLSEPRLWNRLAERQELDRRLGAVRSGVSGALVIRGEAGIGKTALLEYVSARSKGCRVARAAGIEAEMELPFAGLHQLCAPLLSRLDRLPAPQRDALAVAFGLDPGEPPDRFIVGLGVLSLLSEVAEAQPLVCLLDDAQWLDQASAQILAFVARRLAAESVLLVFAVREPGGFADMVSLPELLVGPLNDPDARSLLDSAVIGRADESVLDQIVAEARGNPLALLELPRSWSPPRSRVASAWPMTHPSHA